MSTKWQESCIRALCTSPSAYELFKAKQYNKPLLKQFERKFFKYINIKEEVIVKTNKPKLKKIIQEEDLIKFSSMANFSPLIITNSEELRKKLHSFIKQNEKKYLQRRVLAIEDNGGNYYIELHFSDGFYPDINDSNNTLLHRILRFLRDTIPPDGTMTLQGFRIYNHNCSERLLNLFKEDFCELCIMTDNTQFLTKKPDKKKIKTIKNRMNVGIELEYEGDCFVRPYEKQLKQLGAVSFVSGIDGSDGWRCRNLEPGDRMRENRLRIDGIIGTKALYKLVNDMLSNGSQIPSNGSIHMHVDCKYDNFVMKVRDESNCIYMSPRLKSIANTLNNHLSKQFHKSFEMSVTNALDYNLRIFDSLNQTIEWRFCSAFLNYSTIMADMLLFTYLTNQLKSDTDLNVELIETILKIKQEFVL